MGSIEVGECVVDVVGRVGEGFAGEGDWDGACAAECSDEVDGDGGVACWAGVVEMSWAYQSG